MKHPILLIATVLITLGFSPKIIAQEILPKDNIKVLIAANKTIAWLEYNSQEGQFIAKFPGEPEQKNKNILIADQNTEWNVVTVKNEIGSYTVAYTDLATETIKLGADIVIDSLENTLETDFNWAALNGRGKEILVEGYPGREIIGIHDNKISVARLILADTRLYVVIATSDSLDNVDQFVQSFAVQPWQTYISEEGKFKIDLPTNPQEEKTSREFAGKLFNWNLIEARNFVYPKDSYSVGYTDLSGEDLKDGPDALLDQVIENVISKLSEKGAVENVRSVDMNGSLGRSVIATLDSDQIFILNLYLVNDRLYGVGSVSENISNINRFISSFEIQ